MDGQRQSLIEMTLDMENMHTGFNNIRVLDHNISQSPAFPYYQPLSLKGKQVYRDRCSLRACNRNYKKKPTV